MSNKKTPFVLKLQVAEAVQDDVGNGVVRLDGDTMKKLGVSPGSVLAIKGEKETVAIVARGYPADIGLNLIRMDGDLRRNAKTSIGEVVEVYIPEYQMAKKITIAPVPHEGYQVKIMGSTDSFKASLLGRAVLKGDIISLGGTRSRKRTFTGSPFEDDIFSMISESFMKDMFAPMGASRIKWMITSTNPSGPVLITNDTEVIVSTEAVEINERKVPAVTYEDVGGLDIAIEKLREMVELPLKHPELFERLGVEPPKGVLLYGPPGCGKTMLAKAVANESEAFFISVGGPEIMSKWYGESEKKIREIFAKAEKNAPAIIFIDEIDAIAPKREDVQGEVERRVVAQILSLMDGLSSRGNVIVIGATNRHNALDPALRRPGRFDREVEIGVPDRKGRKEILAIHTRHMPIEEDVNLDKISETTYGYVGADLSSLVKEAAMFALKRFQKEINMTDDQKITNEQLQKIKVTKEDFEQAFKLVRPSVMREIFLEVPKVHWEDIGGLKDTKEKLIESVEWPLKSPDSFRRLGIEPAKGILLYGPPGCGKTMLAKAIATESKANFISIKASEIMSKWVGESEKAIREIFRKARQASPSIIFFDEIDAIAPKRGRNYGSDVTEKVVNQILTEMDGLEALGDVVVIGATNRPDIVDSALLRPGRLDRMILVEPPEEESRIKIFEVHTKGMPLEKDVNLKKLAEKTAGYSGADIKSVCREAALFALREKQDAKIVSMKNFTKALEKIKPSLDKDEIETYKKMEEDMNKRGQIEKEKLSYMN
ncbi:MAG: CDC48 family AAA ATPase [Candidatus Nanoarchaeia archaeon]|nr:CDC48 family AAA ATPase [Candidatus Nanoarchaeia archaeon]